MNNRPLSRKLTADLGKTVADRDVEFATLRIVYLELLCRTRRAARDLREIIEARLSRMGKQYFPWPSTEAPPGNGSSADVFFQYKQGMLGFMGYCVGKVGAPTRERRELLRVIYGETLPRLNSAEYMTEWGRPKSAPRLKKIAESIASFARHAKRNRLGVFREAIADWEADLVFLKKYFYERRYNFKWPDTEAQQAVPSDGPRTRRSARA